MKKENTKALILTLIFLFSGLHQWCRESLNEAIASRVGESHISGLQIHNNAIRLEMQFESWDAATELEEDSHSSLEGAAEGEIGFSSHRLRTPNFRNFPIRVLGSFYVCVFLLNCQFQI